MNSPYMKNRLRAFPRFAMILGVLAMACQFCFGSKSTYVAANTWEGASTVTKDTLTRTNDAAIATRHLLYKQGSTAGGIAVCGASDLPLGTVNNTETETDKPQTLYLLGKGTCKRMVASEAMATAGVKVYAAAGGKIALSGTVPVGILLNTASGDGDVVHVNDSQVGQESPGIPASTYDAHSIVIAVTDNTPVVMPVAASSFVGRKATGNIDDMTAAEARIVLNMLTGKTTSAGASLAIPVTHRFVTKTTGGAEALTLANGAIGQMITITLGTDGGDGTLTPATCTGFATIVFADAGDTATLEYVDDTVGWILIGTLGVAAPPVITL